MQAADQGFPVGLSFDAARALIREMSERHRLATETVAIEAALGATLATEIRAPFDVPGFANSAMDGYAVRGADITHDLDTRLRLVGTALAGGAAPPEVSAGTCVRITTGAILPPGSDTVVMKENTSVEGDFIRISGGAPVGANVRPAGEDYRAGDLALARGVRLTPARIGALASFGMTKVEVARRPRAVLLTTGDEIVAPGSPLGPGQIHDSNRYSLGALLEQHGVVLVRTERLRDAPARLRDALLRASVDADIVVSSGGVSAGEADYMPGLLAEVGKVYLWKVRMKPGMPFLFGGIGNALVFSLPGNPVSGIATFLALVKPALDTLTDSREPRIALRARLAHTVEKRHARVELLRGKLSCDDAATLTVAPLPKQGSGMLAGVADANVLVVIPEAAQTYPAGTIVEVMLFPGEFA